MKTCETKLRKIDYLIIKKMAENNLNMLATAKSVFMSIGGIESRLKIIKRITGLNPKNFYDLVKLLEVCGNGSRIY